MLKINTAPNKNIFKVNRNYEENMPSSEFVQPL